MKKLRHTREQGFSLVETLVAITILLIVITGPMVISTTTARSASFASEQVTAFFLAQEGLEIAQKARDELLLEAIADTGSPPNSFNVFMNDSRFAHCRSTAGCGLEVATDNEGTIQWLPDDCNNGNRCKLYFNDSASTRASYTYNDSTGNEETIYTRVIKFETTANPYEVRVVSTVTWFTGSQREEQKVEAVTYLFDLYGI